MGLRKIYKQYDVVKKEAVKLQKWVLDEFSSDNKYQNILNVIEPDSEDLWLTEIENVVKEYE